MTAILNLNKMSSVVHEVKNSIIDVSCRYFNSNLSAYPNTLVFNGVEISILNQTVTIKNFIREDFDL